MSLSKLLNSFKSSPRAPEIISDPLGELLKLSSTTAKTEDYEYVQTENQSDREHHKYLIHVTSLDLAIWIIKSKRIKGVSQCANFAQNHSQCTFQAEHKGCALIFDWQGESVVGDCPWKIKSNEAYHHVSPYSGDYYETFISHGSPTPLRLIAIALSSDPEPYSTAHILESPISIMVKK